MAWTLVEETGDSGLSNESQDLGDESFRKENSFGIKSKWEEIERL